MLPVATTTITTVEVIKGNTLRGDFTLNVNGVTPDTTTIAWDETAISLDTKLEALITKQEMIALANRVGIQSDAVSNVVIVVVIFIS